LLSRDFWKAVRLLYVRELRCALRERSIVVGAILIPIFLYPGLLWVMFTGMTFVMGETEGFVSRIGLRGPAAVREPLRRRIDVEEKLEVSAEALSEDEARTRIRGGRLDALLELLPPGVAGEGLTGNFVARVTYDGSKERSTVARDRLSDLLDAYRDEWLHREARARGLTEQEWLQVSIVRENTASQKQMGALLLSMMLPFFVIIMVAMGCFFPAVDATAGERERSTWETLMTTSVPRAAIVVSKYLYVASMGATAGLLNLAAMILSMGPVMAPILRDRGALFEFELPWEAFPVMAAGSVLLALFAAAGMMTLAVFARTFKEGQSLATPFYLVLFVPVLLLQSPDLRLTPAMACVPVANVMLVFREAVQGRFDLPLIGLSFLVEAVTVFICLGLAAAVWRFEDVVVGSQDGNPAALVRARLLGRGRVPG
jgi:sodium transport system permease protein